MLLFSAQTVRAESGASWNGAWTGSQGTRYVWPVSISIADGKVVSYTLRGVSFPVRFSDVTPTKVSFGDRYDYVVVLEKTGDRTASGRIHGRKGEGPVTIRRE
jgi:hypothetical protein